MQTLAGNVEPALDRLCRRRLDRVVREHRAEHNGRIGDRPHATQAEAIAVAGLLGWVVSAALLVGVKSLLLNNLQQYFSYNVGLTTSDLIQVIVLAMCVGVLLCGITSFVTLRRYLRV